MNKVNFFYGCFMLFLVIGISGCRQETTRFDGPNLVDRFGPFASLSELTASQPTVDFADGETVFFKASFNKNVAWVLEITGSVSGSVKTIEGFSSELNASNATWNGGTTKLPLFKGEVCNVVLTVPEETGFMATATLETLSGKQYEGKLITDFEEALGLNANVENFEGELQVSRETDFPAEGNFYYRMSGTDSNLPNYFVGLVDLKSTLTGDNYIKFSTTVPEELYFNCFIYSDAGLYGSAIIEFFVDSDGSGDFDRELDSVLPVQSSHNLAAWEGWRKISFPMSEVGATQADLEKIVAIRLLLISDLNAQPNPPIPVDYGIDYLIFTEGGPLEL